VAADAFLRGGAEQRDVRHAHWRVLPRRAREGGVAVPRGLAPDEVTMSTVLHAHKMAGEYEKAEIFSEDGHLNQIHNSEDKVAMACILILILTERPGSLRRYQICSTRS
jgi:hypothetical protein